jgi:hypothetical protein
VFSTKIYRRKLDPTAYKLLKLVFPGVYFRFGYLGAQARIIFDLCGNPSSLGSGAQYKFHEQSSE